MKFHQFDLTIHLHFWKRGNGIDECCGSRIISPAGLFVFPSVSGPSSWEEDANLLELLKSWGPSFKSVSWSTHSIPCIVRRSRIAARHGSGSRKSKGLTGNVGCSRAARCLRIVKCSRIWQGIYFVLWILNLSQQLTHSRRISLLAQGQFIISRLSCSVCFFATNSSQCFNFLAIFCFIFSEESIPNFQFSVQAYFVSLWACSAHWFACCSCYRWDSNSWLMSWRAISEFLFSQCLTSMSASASFYLSWASFSPLTANSAFRSRILWRFWLLLFAQRFGLDLSSFDTDSKTPQWNEFEHSRNSACCRMLAAAWCSGMSK